MTPALVLIVRLDKVIVPFSHNATTMDVQSQKTERSGNSKPTGLYLIELRSRFSGTQARRQKLTPPAESTPSETTTCSLPKVRPAQRTRD
jgi:hypothetical protein